MNGIVRGDNQHILRQEYADGINWNIVTGDNIVTRMDELNVGLQRFVSDILAEPLAKLAADVAVITFARTTTTVKEFGPIRESDSKLKITASRENETLLGKPLSWPWPNSTAVNVSIGHKGWNTTSPGLS